MASSQRIKKVNEVIKRELGRVILKEIDLPKNILVTLTEIETSKDLRDCKVFVSVLPEEETSNVLRVLEKEIYELQQILNQRLVMRPVPKIRFFQEKRLKETQKIEKILDEIKDDQE